VELVEADPVVAEVVAPVVGAIVGGSALVLEVELLDVSGADCPPPWGQAEASKVELKTASSGPGCFMGASMRIVGWGFNARRRAACGR
jgi:hypothetical protein